MEADLCVCVHVICNRILLVFAHVAESMKCAVFTGAVCTWVCALNCMWIDIKCGVGIRCRLLSGVCVCVCVCARIGPCLCR